MVHATTMSMESTKLGSMKLTAPRDVIEKVIKSMSDGGDEEALKLRLIIFIKRVLHLLHQKILGKVIHYFQNNFQLLQKFF
jgi:hypothetical protein